MLYNLERRESLHPYGKVGTSGSSITLLCVEVDEDVELECPDEATATGEEGVRGDAAKAVEATSPGRTPFKATSEDWAGKYPRVWSGMKRPCSCLPVL